MKPATMVSGSPSETKTLGRRVAREILKEKPGRPVIIALKGELGSGKTTFVQGFARGLGIRNRITSPTFIIFRHYPVRNSRHFFHMDAYRLRKTSEFRALNFRDLVSRPGNITLIEWPERIKKTLPRGTILIEFRHGRKENERVILAR